MGAGQIAGIATLLGHDLGNAAGFDARNANNHEGQFVVYFMSHSMIFCVGALLEANIVLTTASCVYAEKHQFPVYGGSHQISKELGIFRTVDNKCLHRSYRDNDPHGMKGAVNVAILLLDKPFSFESREPTTHFLMSRIRYSPVDWAQHAGYNFSCYSYGWGSRRNGLLLPLSMRLLKMKMFILKPATCTNLQNGTLCLKDRMCKNQRFGALCADDLGSPLVCNGHIVGMSQSSIVNRPCGYGYLNISALYKFMTCAVDDSIDMHRATLVGRYVSDPIPKLHT